MATTFKRYGRGGRFKKPAIGDAGISALRQRDQTIIDSLQLSRNQQAEIDKDQMSAMERAFTKEEQNIEDLQRLEDKIYANKRDNIKLRAQREVEALKGQADEYGRQAEHWEQLSPKLGKALQSLAKGYGNVVTRMGYDEAARNQNLYDTLSIWEPNFQRESLLETEANAEKLVEAAHEQNEKEILELKKQGVAPTPLVGKEQMSAWRQTGKVFWVTKDLEKNIDTHIRHGLDMWVRNGNELKTQSDYNKALAWVQSSIEEAVGIKDFKYHRGVREFRETFNKHASTANKDWTNKRLAQITATQFKDGMQILEDAGPLQRQANVDKMVNYVMLHHRDKDGNLIANNASEAYSLILNTWAADLQISDDELQTRVELLTLKEGRQPGDKASIEGRHPNLVKAMWVARLDAQKKKNDQFTITKNTNKRLAWEDAQKVLDQNLSPTELIENADRIEKEYLHGGKTVSDKLRRIADIDGIKYSDKHIESEITTLINSGKPLQALTMLRGNAAINGEKRKDLMQQISFVNDWSNIGRSFEGKHGIEETLRGKLKHDGLGFKGDHDTANESVERKLNEAIKDLALTYQQELNVRKDNRNIDGTPWTKNQKIEAAYNAAMDKVSDRIAKNEGIYRKIPAMRRKGFNVPIFADHATSDDRIDNNDLSSIEPIEFRKLARQNKMHTLLDKEGVLTNNQEKSIIRSLNSNTPLTAASDTVSAILDDLPDNHELKGNINGVYRQLLLNSPNDEAKEAAKLIEPDLIESVSGIDPNNQTEAHKANNHVELIKRLAWLDTPAELMLSGVYSNPRFSPELYGGFSY